VAVGIPTATRQPALANEAPRPAKCRREGVVTGGEGRPGPIVGIRGRSSRGGPGGRQRAGESGNRAGRRPREGRRGRSGS